jgi:hypothetical protein
MAHADDFLREQEKELDAPLEEEWPVSPDENFNCVLENLNDYNALDSRRNNHIK